MNFMQHELLFDVQDKKKNCINLDLLFYWKKMPPNLLKNQYTSLNIINDARAIIYIVMSHFDSEFLVFYHNYTDINQLLFKDLI